MQDPGSLLVSAHADACACTRMTWPPRLSARLWWSKAAPRISCSAMPRAPARAAQRCTPRGSCKPRGMVPTARMWSSMRAPLAGKPGQLRMQPNCQVVAQHEGFFEGIETPSCRGSRPQQSLSTPTPLCRSSYLRASTRSACGCQRQVGLKVHGRITCKAPCARCRVCRQFGGPATRSTPLRMAHGSRVGG